MSETRALMTDTERDRIAGREAVNEQKRYQAISRVRRRIRDRLGDDVEVLRDHHEELFQELLDVVCSERIAATGVSGPREAPAAAETDVEASAAAPTPAGLGAPEEAPHTDVTASREPSVDRTVSIEDDEHQEDVGDVEEISPEVLVDVQAHLDDVEFPGNKPRDECIEAVAAAYRYLQDERQVTMRDFVRDVLPSHSIGYDVVELQEGERYRGAWWRRVVRPGLQELPGVRVPEGNDRYWRAE